MKLVCKALVHTERKRRGAGWGGREKERDLKKDREERRA